MYVKCHYYKESGSIADRIRPYNHKYEVDQHKTHGYLTHSKRIHPPVLVFSGIICVLSCFIHENAPFKQWKCIDVMSRNSYASVAYSIIKRGV